MFITEVSNDEYAEFLDCMTEDELKEKHSVKSRKWTEVLKYADPHSTHYFSHPAYQGYSVVNATQESAKA